MILALLLAIIPHDSIARDRCDVLERNHHYTDEGKLRYEQLIVWRFCPNTSRFRCEAWRSIDYNPIYDPHRRPEYDWATGRWVARFNDGDVLRDVSAIGYRETWTQDGVNGDPERADLELYPLQSRRELLKSAPSKPGMP